MAYEKINADDSDYDHETPTIHDAAYAFAMFRVHNTSFIQHSTDYTPTKFGLNTGYMSLDHKYDNLWDDELVGHNAIVWLPPEERVEPTLDIGSISMFHSLHCLTSLRKALQNATEGQHIGKDFHDNAHWPHCLDYLRQSIICAADPTIELPRLSNGSILRQASITGAGDTHQCRSAEQLYLRRQQYGQMNKEQFDAHVAADENES